MGARCMVEVASFLGKRLRLLVSDDNVPAHI